MRQVLAGLVALTLSGLAMASTECTSTVSSIEVETGRPDARYIVYMSSGISIDVSKKTVNRDGVMTLVFRAHSFGESVTLRFGADGVDCNKPTRRGDLIAVVTNRTESAVIVTPPASTTTVVTPPSTRP